ncbi:MAG: magnesium chelatase [Chloroflexota bacterium]|nr:MAG: magnesium chelatase [Chloroflexota bacterium]
MLAKIYSGTMLGLQGKPVEVEVDLAKKGFPSFKIVGLPDKAVNEARDRVRSALLNSNIDFPKYRLTVNLAPANLPKEGSAFDLPIAVGIMLASGQLPPTQELKKSIFVGELSLEGCLRKTAGILPLTLWAKSRGFKQIFLPAVNAKEASIVKGINILPLETLAQLVYHFQALKTISPHPPTEIKDLIEQPSSKIDFDSIKGQEQAKRALIIAAAGGHNVFMIGPPGSGKTLLARALPSILPRLTEDEALEVTQIYSISGNLPSRKSLITRRPFRSPHHTTSRIGLIGGGSKPQPGEISLAHRGVLFLDEFPEYARHVLESLRQPMEDGEVTISRAAASLTFPAKFMLVAAANPCPCGYLNSKQKKCSCLPAQINRYQKRISGPILDRIDIHLHVPEVASQKILPSKRKTTAPEGLTTKKARTLVQKARDVQFMRFKDYPHLTCNAEIGPKEIERFCQLEDSARQLLQQAYTRYHLTARGYHKVIKVARTIADLSQDKLISADAVSEALRYRRREWSI